MSKRWTLKDIKMVQQKLASNASAYRYYVGIDCGVETGLAVWDVREKKLIEVKTIKIHQAMDEVRNWTHLHAFVRVEDARLREYLPEEKNNSEYRGKLMGAGSVMRDAKIWEDFLTDLFNTWTSVGFEMVAPKHNKTKLKPAEFARITGWKKRCSVHARDAAMLIFGY